MLTRVDFDWIEDQLRREPDALNEWSWCNDRRWSKRQSFFTKEQWVAYCRNMAEQRARRLTHGTGAT